jgi:multisubunit Na+/H+ antiporter MnhB subunit
MNVKKGIGVAGAAVGAAATGDSTPIVTLIGMVVVATVFVLASLILSRASSKYRIATRMQSD